MRTASEHAEAQATVYPVPDARVWTELRALLAERGYALPAAPAPRDATVYTSWESRDDTRTAYLVRFTSVDAAQFTVYLRRVTEHIAPDAATPTTILDPDAGLEWELVQRAYPARAAVIRAAADKRARRTGQAVRGCARAAGEAAAQ